MEDIEERALTSFPSRPPILEEVYVDNARKSLEYDELESFHHHLKCLEHFIMFPYEVEEEGKLDTEITHHPDGDSINNSLSKEGSYQ